MVVENEEKDVKLILDFWRQQTSTLSANPIVI
jgi:hypothetical protein